MVGRLSDIFGRRNFFLIGNVIAVIGTALVAKSTTLGMAIAGTTLIGSASAMHQISFAAISEVVPKKIRPFTQGVFQMVLSFSGGTAPIIGRLLADSQERNDEAKMH
jgi:MFS family permease